MVSRFASLRWYAESDTLRIAIAHTGVNLFMAHSVTICSSHSKIFIKNNLKKLKKLETLVLQGVFYALFCGFP